MDVSQRTTESIFATKTMVIRSSTNSILPFVSTQALKSTQTMKVPPMGPKPVPKATIPVPKKNETITSFSRRGTVLARLSSTIIDLTSSTEYNTSSIIGMKTMVNYKSSIVDKGIYNQTSGINRTPLTNFTSTTTHEISPSSEFKKSVDFTSSVSDYKSSIIDHSSSISLSVSSVIVGHIMSASDSISKMSDHSSSVSDHERRFTGYKATLSIKNQYTTQYKQSFLIGSNNSSQILATSTKLQVRLNYMFNIVGISFTL